MVTHSSFSGDRIELPTDFAEHIAKVSGLETPPTTWEEWWSGGAEKFAEADQTLGFSDLYKDEPTEHEVQVDDQVRYARCAADALTAAVMEQHPTVTVRSIDPVTDTEVRIEVNDDSVDVAPEEAVICFGSKINREDIKSAGTIADWSLQEDKTRVEAAVCQHTLAFESKATYQQWASESEAITAPIPPARFVDLARGLTGALK